MNRAQGQFSDLSHLVLPRSIALIGASDRADSVGGRTLDNLLAHSSYQGKLHLVNPTRSQVRGMACHPSVKDVGTPVDVAIVAVKADSVLPALEESAALGTKFAMVLTSGFGEVGEEGRRAEARMAELARSSGMRIYGPNCPGLNNINARLGMTFSPAYRFDQMPGPIGLATQGGGMGRTIIQAMARGIGTGLWFSAGNEVDLEVSDFVHYMATADDIKVIATTLEGVRNGPRFLEACQHAARHGKPIVAMKIGKSEYGMKAAQSHTAAITGSAEVNSAVFRELGVTEVEDVDELVDVAALLARGLPTGREKVAVFCYSGGTAALAADKVGQAGLELASFTDATTATLQSQLPPYAAISNPVDTTAVVLTDPEIGYASLKAVAQDPNVGAVIYPIPFDYGEVTTTAARSAVRVQQEVDKPIVMVWMSDKLGDGYPVLVEGGIVPARSVENAVKAVQRYLERGAWQSSHDAAWRPGALAGKPEVAHMGDSQPTPVREHEAKARLKSAGIRVPRSRFVAQQQDVAKAFSELEAPVVAIKIVSPTITHKSDVGGVLLGIRTADAAVAAFEEMMRTVAQAAPGHALEGVLLEEMLEGPFAEVVIGVHRDPVFGHVCTFGLGGIAIELFKDVSRRLLPLTPQRARAMVEETRCVRLLKGFRGKPATDIDALVDALVSVSTLVTTTPGIEELEINPLAVLPQGGGVVALDAVLNLGNDKQ
ncbi:acetate--CoA ligase family protein [Ramlibacter sp. G-1-2-2]|uniref:Acetate--CoA ligase family protein n=1 Tax=Ramlibacter agri TaxID=2728837 RepID=A0A848HCC9_9BURK|nr:acetate--CoA ligase family protein [Ramlibacter agri]NML48716.1 acetate--CoA ligase family protein [Ramlibacter agri]